MHDRSKQAPNGGCELVSRHYLSGLSTEALIR
jgi:hypothetical protein